MDSYRTLGESAKDEYIVQKSRFIAHAAPVQSADEALQFLEEIKKEHKTASHNCFAYIIGANQGIMRYSDDGEPSGTAGKPIIDVMMAKEIVNAAVVVTRYFGGILLGAGGLLRAYTHSAVLAIDAAAITVMEQTVRWNLVVSYPLWDRVDHSFGNLPLSVETVEYTNEVSVSLLCREKDEDRVMQTLTAVTDGKIRKERDPILFYHPWNEKTASQKN